MTNDLQQILWLSLVEMARVEVAMREKHNRQFKWMIITFGMFGTLFALIGVVEVYAGGRLDLMTVITPIFVLVILSAMKVMLLCSLNTAKKNLVRYETEYLKYLPEIGEGGT